MSITDDLAAKDALIQKLTSEKHAQAELLKKQCEILIQYLVLDIEDYLAEAREKAEEEEAAAAATQQAAEYGSDNDNDSHHRGRFSKYRHLHLGLYNDVPIRRILRYQAACMWEQWATNPYGLHPVWYALIMLMLWTWLVGSVVIGYYEAGPESGSARLAKLGRAFLGSIPPIVQFLLFLFPPLFVQF